VPLLVIKEFVEIEGLASMTLAVHVMSVSRRGSSMSELLTEKNIRHRSWLGQWDSAEPGHQRTSRRCNHSSCFYSKRVVRVHRTQKKTPPTEVMCQSYHCVLDHTAINAIATMDR
jgi:hypothetical protein